jgi:glycosyltransferase involved in cell wall biosynthesis
MPTAPDYFFKRSRFYQKNVQRIFAEATAVTNVSETISLILQKIFTIRKISIIRNAVDEKLFFYSPKLEGNFRFVHVSTMNYQKNFDGLMNAFEKLYAVNHEVELLLVGPMPSTASARLDRSPAKLAVMCTGEVHYTEVARFMQEANSLVLFSRYENFPCVIIEALCCGLPVITTNAGGASEALKDLNGIVIPIEDETALLAAMKKMILEYAGYHRQSIAEDARLKYSYLTIGKNFEQLYLAAGLR